MRQVPIGELLAQRVPSVDPAKFSDERFTLWSIPSFDLGRPEIVFGSEIGSTKKLVQDGDILLSKIVPHIRRAWIVHSRDTNRQIASSEWIVFRDQRFLPGFVKHFLITDGFHNRFMATVAGVGGSLLRAQPKEVAKIMMPYPSLDEQRQIVELLDRASEIRRRANAARTKARAIIPALFLDTFGDPATNPKGWRVVTVGDLRGVELRNGISPSKTGTVIGSVLMLSAITRGTFDPNARKESTFAGPLAQQQTVSQSLFLICRGNGNRELVGRGAFPYSNMPGVAFPDTMIALRIMEAQIKPAYLAAVWSSAHLRAQIDLAAKTTNGTFKISQSAIVKFSFPLPPPQLQVAFAEQVERLEVLARHLDDAAAKAEAMAAALSAEVFG